MKLIELTATSEKIDVKNNNITYETGIDAPPGLLVLSDTTGEHGLLLTNQIHNGGPIVLKMKPFITPAKKYKFDEVVATLVVF